MDNGGDQNFLAVKKYVIGSPVDLAGIAAQQRYPNNTYMMRLGRNVSGLCRSSNR